MVIDVQEKFARTGHVKINDKPEKYISRGERYARHHDKILSNQKKSMYFHWFFIISCALN